MDVLFTITIFLHASIFHLSGSQFAYPADPNPPQFNTTFTCFECEGAGCDVKREEGVHEETSCTGPRVACWIIQNMDTSVYTRTCVQPATIRQGVFCNRHMEGKEFCYASVTTRGRERLCGKCCLNNRCNRGKLQGVPDATLQTCVACQGSREEFCNSDLTIRSLANSTYTEQCLLPNSDCWTEKRSFSGRSEYSRGCQLRTCDQANSEEECFMRGNQEICEFCCKGRLCNRFSNNYVHATPSGLITVLLLFTCSALKF